MNDIALKMLPQLRAKLFRNIGMVSLLFIFIGLEIYSGAHWLWHIGAILCGAILAFMTSTFIRLKTIVFITDGGLEIIGLFRTYFIKWSELACYDCHSGRRALVIGFQKPDKTTYSYDGISKRFLGE